MSRRRAKCAGLTEITVVRQADTWQSPIQEVPAGGIESVVCR